MRVLIEIFFVLSVSGLILKAMSEPSDKKSDYDKGYDEGYRKAKLIYECDHDRVECEILKRDTI